MPARHFTGRARPRARPGGAIRSRGGNATPSPTEAPSKVPGRRTINTCMVGVVNPGPAQELPSTWDNSDTAAALIVSKNLVRRHLNTSQRAMVAAKLATYEWGGDRSKPPNGDLKLNEVAQSLSVGKRTVERARKILNNGTPEVRAAAPSRRHYPGHLSGCPGTDRRTIDAGVVGVVNPRPGPKAPSGAAAATPNRDHPGRLRGTSPAMIGFRPGPKARRYRPPVTILGTFAGAWGRTAGPSTPGWSAWSTRGQTQRRHPEPRRQSPTVITPDTFAGAWGWTAESSTPA